MSKKAAWFILLAAAAMILFVLASPGEAAQADPEEIDFANYMAVSETHIYYSTDGNLELKCAQLTGEVYGRVAKGGGADVRERYLTNCDGAPYPRSAMATDGQTTFFISYLQDIEVHALFSRPADGSAPADQLTLDQHLAPRALVLDEGFVYFATLEGAGSQILRREAATGTVQVVAAIGDLLGNSVNGLAVDDTYVYWTEGEQGAPGRVRRALKTGGPPAVVADGLDLPWDLMPHGDRVYWTELEGERVARRLKTGGGVTEAVYETDRPVTSLYLHQTTLYVGTGNAGARNGALYRMTQNGGSPTLMAFGFPPPNHIVRAGGYVYWVDGQLRRLRFDAESDPVDYTIEKWEVTQGVQDGTQSMPLVALKPIFVRVYAHEAQGSAGDTVRAQLRGYIDGVELPQSPLQPILNNNQDLTADIPLRADTARTYTFSLPHDWTATDRIELQAEINPNKLVFESDYGNNLFPTPQRKFTMTAPFICLVTFPVAAVTPEGDTAIFDNDPAVYDPRMDRARAMLPIWLNVFKDPTEVWWNIGVVGPPIPHNLTAPGGEAFLLASIAQTAALSDPPPGCPQAATRYGGIVPRAADYPANFGGRANGDHFWARWWEGGGVAYIQPAGGFLWAHETGHTLGRPHVDCGSAGSPGFFPYPRCQSDDSEDENAFWGYDPISGMAPNPVDNPDLMAYGSPRWVSDFTWKCILDYVSDIWGLPGTGQAGCYDPLARAAAPPAPETVAQNGAQNVSQSGMVIAGTGIVTDDGLEMLGLITYDSVEQLTEAQQAHLENSPRYGQWMAIAFDAQGVPVASQNFLPGEPVDDSDGLTLNLIEMAMVANNTPARLEIREAASGDVLFAQSISDAAPKLVLDSAAVDRNGDMVVDLQAVDADGDPLNIIAQYIGPNGRKQVMFHTRGAAGSSLTCDPCTWPGRTLPGGVGIVRIFASDGLRTTVAQQRVTVPNKAPEVNIVATQHGPLDADGWATFGLRASIFDAEDNTVESSSVIIKSWSMGSLDLSRSQTCPGCRQKTQTTIEGESMIFVSRDLVGEEVLAGSSILEVTLTVIDTDGNETVKQIVVDLQPQKQPPGSKLYLPVVSRE